ncbi:MAG: bifunctional diaminohydroxyphosphoribosylaminopyrimidine deaminase/5-amino-6-(5-phosphoribosylamino)uracil reductase RibD [Planctomycetota bacterium]
MTDARADRRYLDLAARLAMRAAGDVEPNPMVGCVLVRNSEVVGYGHHRKFGELHAEREAIADARTRGNDVRGCTAYVTLEPCNHHGKQPPCVDALLEEGVAEIVFARRDANPEASGGAERLRDSGATVRSSDASRMALAVGDAWAKRVRTRHEGLELPWVIAKWAQTIDGRIATRTGQSQWISNEASRGRVHRLRARVDVILTALGTVHADDPMLTARGMRRVRRVARRVIIDPSLDIPMESQLVRTAGEVPTTVACARSVAEASAFADRRADLKAAGVELMAVASNGNGGELAGRLDLRDVLHRLAVQHDATNVMIEAGPGLLGSLFEADVVDEAVVYVAPLLLGDDEALAAARGRAVPSLSQGRPFRLARTKRVGDDVELTYRRAE